MEHTPVSAFSRGASAAWRGLRRALGDREIARLYARLVAALFGLIVALDVVGIWAVLHFTQGDGSEDWLGEIGLLLLRIAAIALVLLIAPVIAMFITNVVFPFLGDRVFFASLRGIDPERAHALETAPGLPLGTVIGTALVRLLLFLGLSLVTFALSFVPVAGAVVAPLLQAYFTARALAWEMLDPWFDKLEMRFDAQHVFVKQHRAALVGFGLPFSFVMAIPLVGPFLFGLAQAAAANLVHEALQEQAPAQVAPVQR